MKNKKETKLKNFLLSLQEDAVISGYRIKKKYILGIFLTILIYIIGVLLSVNMNSSFTSSENQKAYEELMKEQQSRTENVFKEQKIENIQDFEKMVNETLNMSDAEIKEIFKRQGLEVTDSEIAEVRREATKNLPKNQKEYEEQMKRLNEAVKEIEKKNAESQEKGRK